MLISTLVFIRKDYIEYQLSSLAKIIIESFAPVNYHQNIQFYILQKYLNMDKCYSALQCNYFYYP